MQTYEAKISGMTCASCERIISKYIAAVPGVELLSIHSEDGQMLLKAEGGLQAALLSPPHLQAF